MLALSCFDTLENAKAKWQKVASTSPRFVGTVGQHIASVELVADDGRVTEPNPDGHFDFFESQACDLNDRLTVVSRADA